MAEKKQVMDVSKPGKTPADESAKPIIVGHRPQVQDPMVSPAAEAETEVITDSAAPVEEAAMSPSASKKVIAPLSDMPKPESADATPAETPEEAKTDATDGGSEQAVVGAIVGQMTDKRKEELQNDEELKKQEEFRKLVASKKYFVPIGQKKRQKRLSVIVLVVVLTLLGGTVLAADAGLVNLGVKLPFDFIKDSSSAEVVDSAATANDTPASNSTPTKVDEENNTEAPKLAEFKSEEFGFRFAYPTSWTKVTLEEDTLAGATAGKAYRVSFENTKLLGGFVTIDFKSTGGFIGFTKYNACVDPTVSTRYTYEYFKDDSLCVVVIGVDDPENTETPKAALLLVQKRFDKSTKTAGLEFRHAPVALKDFAPESVKAAYSEDILKEVTELAKSISEL